MSAAIKPTGWDAKQVAIALSAERRAALRAFADSVEPRMSKSEALYALMDIALPTAPGWNRRVDMAREAALTSASAADRCAAALEQVSLALAPLDGLISDEQGPPRKSAASSTASSPTKNSPPPRSTSPTFTQKSAAPPSR